MIGRRAVLPSALILCFVVSLAPAPRAANDSPLKLADLAWDQGDYPTALNVVHDLMTQRMQQFEHVAAHELPIVYEDFGLSDEGREVMRNYVADLQNWLAGILHWHQEVDRYKAEYLARRSHGFLPDRGPAVPVLS